MRVDDPTNGDWRKYGPDEIRRIIYEKVGKPNLDIIHKLDKEGRDLFEKMRDDISSILTLALEKHQDSYINNHKEEVEKQALYNTLDLRNLDPHTRPIIIQVTLEFLLISRSWKKRYH